MFTLGSGALLKTLNRANLMKECVYGGRGSPKTVCVCGGVGVPLKTAWLRDKSHCG